MDKPQVKLKYYGEAPIMARLSSGASKVQFKKGQSEWADLEKAKALAGAYKFEIVNAEEAPKKPKRGKKDKKEIGDPAGNKEVEAESKEEEKASK